MSALALILVVATSATAGEPRTHDGFFLRLSGGGGYGQSKIDVPQEFGGGELEFSGGTGDINFAIGAAVSPGLIVHGTFWGWLTSDPDVKLNGESAPTTGTTLDMSSFGAGITYYVMPANFYFSPSIGFSTITLEVDNEAFNTDTGFGLDFTVGKEWWVSDGWGIGVAGAFSYHSVSDSDIDEKWSGPAYAIRFSATYN